MGLLVRRQVARLRKALVAAGEVAHVGLFTCMRAQVGSQVEVQGEPLVTQRAFEWLLSSVHQLVPFQL